MIFEAEPEQIKDLDSKQLVRLMHLLLLAECRLAQIPLRASHVPLQITVSDGGEDGRVEWAGGADSTPYFPSRYCVFQAKAQNLTEASVKNEILKQEPKTKTKRRGRAKAKKSKQSGLILNDAISNALKKHGAYAILSSSAFTGQKRDKLKKAIEAAVRTGGGNPQRLTAIEILDANKIAEWVNCHPSVALWLANHSRRRSLAGFQTHEGWGKSADIRSSSWVEEPAPRFLAANVFIPEHERADPRNKAWTFEQVAVAILEQLSKEQKSVRIAGPSGFGKSRFVYEVFNRRAVLADQADNTAVIYADHSIVGDELAKLALEIAESGSSSILVVDECSDQLHHKLASIAQRADSFLRVLTIDVETRVYQNENVLTIRVEPASNELISGIAKAIDPTIADTSVRFIQDLSHGFPQMAVLAARQKGSGKQTVQSAQQYIERVLWGQRAPKDDAQKALSVLSLFDWVGIAGRMTQQAERIASELANMSLDAFVEHIKSFKSRGVVIQRGDFVQVQPIPLAARLGVERLQLLPDGKLISFFYGETPELKKSLLARIRWLDSAPEARDFAATLLAQDAFGNFETINTELGSEVIDRLAHVAPDLVMTTVDRLFGNSTIEELAVVKNGRRHLVWALEKLVFRKNSFERAARLLRKLGAAETEDHIGNNAAGQFKGLYRLYLSGTEADPEARLRVLDEGLQSTQESERALCIDALGGMLDTGHYSRGGGAEEIGSADPLVDWEPKTYGEIHDFLRASISRLIAIALGGDPFADKAKALLGSHIRGLLNHLELKEIRKFVDAIVQRHGFWPEAVQEINEWMYFDSEGTPPKIKNEIRTYFDELMPTDPVELAALYCRGWQIDFHNPDSTYDRENRSGHDFEYAIRKSVELAGRIAGDQALVKRALDVFTTSDAKSAFPFARRLAELATDPVSLFNQALEKAEASDTKPNLPFFGGMIAGADICDPKMARACVRLALQSDKLKPHAISMIGSGKLQLDDLKLVVSLLQAAVVAPSQCAPLSYGRGLDHLTSKEIAPLLDELARHGATGLWTALDMILMYLHPDKMPDRVLEKKMKTILLSPKLFDQINRRTADGYCFQQAVGLLAKHNMLSGPDVRALVKRVLGLAKVEQSDIFFELDDPARKILDTLIPKFPKEVWAEVVSALLWKDPRQHHRLQRLLKPDRDDHFGPGPLFGLPQEIYLDWVRKDLERRAPFIAEWLPVATKNDDGSLCWHPAIESFVAEFGKVVSVLGMTARRMHPTGWSGSLVPHLEPWVPLLKSWLNHPLAEVRTWAQQRIEGLQEYIDAEKKRDEEDVVR